ncbi:MAG: phosphatidate cytidylyltransferase [Lachnospiraceae bacterium]
MFKTRLLSGIVLILIALVTLISGGDILFATVVIISFIGMTELYKIVDVQKSLLGVVGYLGAIGYFAMIRLGCMQVFPLMVISFLILLMAVYVFAFPKYESNQVVVTFFGLFYVAVMLSYIYLTRRLDQGIFLVWLVFICSWGSDTCAYCVGMLFGKHKMAPKLSPKKSIEGGIGGIVGAALLGALYGIVVNQWATGAEASIPIYAFVCGVGSGISQIGDLAASAIKRNHEIKDYGTLIPGHGGILDRFDSVIFTAPVIYYLTVMFMK